MKRSIIIRVNADSCERIFIGLDNKIHVRFQLPIPTPFKAYFYCPKASEPVYREEDGERNLVYYKDDLAVIHDALGGISIRNPYGSLGRKDILLNDFVVAIAEIERIERCEKGFDLCFNSDNVKWLIDSPMNVSLVAPAPPLVWSYCHENI